MWEVDFPGDGAQKKDKQVPVLFEGALPCTCLNRIELPLRLEGCARTSSEEAELLMIIGRDRYYFVAGVGS